jgi:integrase
VKALAASPVREGSSFVFPATRGHGPIVGVKLFQLAVRRSGLKDVSIHTLRHSFASTALPQLENAKKIVTEAARSAKKSPKLLRRRVDHYPNYLRLLDA